MKSCCTDVLSGSETWKLNVEKKRRFKGNKVIFDIYMSVHRNIITNYSQQVAGFFLFIYFYRRSACFRRFLRSSSGANNCTYSFRYCQPILLLAAIVDEMELTFCKNKEIQETLHLVGCNQMR
jgi:hypothetical protein